MGVLLVTKDQSLAFLLDSYSLLELVLAEETCVYLYMENCYRCSKQELKMDWVVDFKKKIEKKEISKVAEGWEKLSIYKVPVCTKNLHRNSYTPLAVSFGPYHYEEELNMQMEAHKHRALYHFLQNSGKPIETYVNELKKVVLQLMGSYESLDSKWNQNEFLQMMLLDGCFMLEILRANAAIKKPGDIYGDRDYGGVKDPVFSYHGKVYVMPHMKRDMLMLENQIPMLLLINLVEVEGIIPDPVEYLNKLILEFINPGVKYPSVPVGSSLHVLDLYRKSLLGFGLNKPRDVLKSPCNMQDIVRSAEKLHQAGVDFKTSPTNSLTDISFDSGTLKLPIIIVDDTSESAYLNLMVFERLHVGAGNDVTSFISFMDSLIDSPKDVSLLHSDGIIYNSFGSEKAVANLFNGISKDVTPDPDGRLERVHSKLNEYCNEACNSHKAYIRRTYLKNPWASASLVAAIFLMILTLAQTIYTIIAYHLPKKKN